MTNNQSSIKSTENNTQYSETCAAKNISKCMNCNAIIRGEIHYDGVLNGDEIKQSSYCHECGTPYPWASNGFRDLIKMVEYFELNPEEAEN